MDENFLLTEQKKLNLIRKWLSDTTEPFDEWDFDGKELILLLKHQIIERYSKEDIKNFIKGFL